jgi:hypothetical protein
MFHNVRMATVDDPPRQLHGLGTWLLQQPTHRDHDPTDHGRDTSVIQLHLKDPESSLS